MNLRHHVSVIWSAAWLVVLAFVVGIGLGYFVSVQLPRVYEGRATLYVGQSLNDANLGYNGILASQFLAQTYAELATTRPVLTAVIEELGLNVTPETLANNVQTQAPPSGTLLSVLAHDTSPDRAAAIANSVAHHVQALAPAQDPKAASAAQARLAELDAAIADTEKRIVNLLGVSNRTAAQDGDLGDSEQRLASLTSARSALVQTLPGLSPNTLTLVETAAPSDNPVAPPRALITAAIAAMLVALAVAFAYVRHAWRRSPREASVAEADDAIAPNELPTRFTAPDRVSRSEQ